jgi:hypothetical protein
MRGDATVFTRRDEAEGEWRIITPIEEARARLPAPRFPDYAAGSEGPTSWHELLELRAILPNERSVMGGRRSAAVSIPEISFATGFDRIE